MNLFICSQYHITRNITVYGMCHVTPVQWYLIQRDWVCLLSRTKILTLTLMLFVFTMCILWSARLAPAPIHFTATELISLILQFQIDIRYIWENLCCIVRYGEVGWSQHSLITFGDLGWDQSISTSRRCHLHIFLWAFTYYMVSPCSYNVDMYSVPVEKVTRNHLMMTLK